MRAPSEPISPELVLVDSELRSRTIELLPDCGFELPADVASSAPTAPPSSEREEGARLEDEPADSPAALPASAPLKRIAAPTEPGALDSLRLAVLAAQAPVSESAPRPRRRRRWLWAIGLGALLAIAGAIAYGALRPKPTIATEQVDQRAPPSSVATSVKARARDPREQKSVASAAGSRAGIARKRVGASPPAGRAFAWVAVAGAAFYDVRFQRGRTTIFRTQTTAPGFVLPREWTYRGQRHRLEPGAYVWSVRPLFRSKTRLRRGAPVVQAKLVIAANTSRRSARRSAN